MARRLLLVEDSATMRRMIATWLQQEGYEVSTAGDGREGLEKARAEYPELIVTDFEMPELDGPGFCRALREDEALRSIPVIMLTTLGATENKVFGLDAGADDYIEKPKSPEEVQEIFARVRAQLRIADLRKELAQRNHLLEQAQNKLDLELKLARKVQFGLMPRPPRPRGVLRLAVSYEPANQLGGDLYDLANLDQKRLAVLVLDISGHGVNSALLSGVVKALASPLILSGDSPQKTMEALDASVEPFIPEDYFFSAFYMIFNEESGTFDYAGVGHPPAILVGEKRTLRLHSDEGLMGFGMVSDLMGGSGELGPGESVLIYTDGLCEAMAPSGAQFGEDRIEEILSAHRTDEPSDLIERLKTAVASHSAPNRAYDDINMVLIQNQKK